MSDSPLMNIIFLLVAAAVGYAVGLLDRRVTSGLKQKKQEKDEILANEKASAQMAAEKARLEQMARELATREEALKELAAQKEPAFSGEPAALVVQFDPAQNCTLALDGQPIVSGELTPEQRQRLVGIVVQIRPWIDNKPMPKPATPIPPPAPASSQIPVSAPSPLPRIPVSRPAGSPAPTAPRIDPIRGFRSMVENDGKKKEMAPLVSVVSLIDDVLQRQLINTPLELRGIRLEEGPMGAVMVHVGAVRYNSIDEVPQPEIQAAIRNAIAEFNR